MNNNRLPVYIYRGRIFSVEEIEKIRHILTAHPQSSRVALSIMICKEIGWRNPTGKFKDRSCLEALLRMEQEGLITLPPRRMKRSYRSRAPIPTTESSPGFPIRQPASLLRPLKITQIITQKQARLWNEIIERYHYLKYQPLIGAQLRYFIECSQGLLAAVGFQSAAWKCRVRDKWIGWTTMQREQRLPLIVNNTRFLILPWIRSRCLASMILAMIARQIPHDWHKRYGYDPVLLESFVDAAEFNGTCYRAANWVHIGMTTGRGKYDRFHKNKLSAKHVLVYPLKKNWKQILTEQPLLSDLNH